MKQCVLEVSENVFLTEKVCKMTLKGDLPETKPGRFVNIALNGQFLRRPISVYDCENGKLTIVYKIVGEGTEKMSRLEKGEKLDVLCDLGNGYDLTKSGNNPVLIGGGVGVPPLYMLAKKLVAEGKKPTVVLGFNTKKEIFAEKEFKELGVETIVMTADGTYGGKGFVTDALKNINYSYYYACGPEGMLKAVYNECKTSGQLSFEERMGCGFGACMGCSKKVVSGYKRICKDGPVLEKEELIW